MAKESTDFARDLKNGEVKFILSIFKSALSYFRCVFIKIEFFTVQGKWFRRVGEEIGWSE